MCHIKYAISSLDNGAFDMQMCILMFFVWVFGFIAAKIYVKRIDKTYFICAENKLSNLHIINNLYLY